MSFILQLKYKEVYEKSKAQINIDPEAHDIRAAKEAYRNITNVRVSLQISACVHYLSLSWHTRVCSGFSLPIRRNTKPPRTSGSGQLTGPTSSTLPRTPCSRAMWAHASSLPYMCTLTWTTSYVAAVIVLLLQVEYKYDKEMMKGCVIPVVDDKLTILALKNAEMASAVSLLFAVYHIK